MQIDRNQMFVLVQGILHLVAAMPRCNGRWRDEVQKLAGGVYRVSQLLGPFMARGDALIVVHVDTAIAEPLKLWINYIGVFMRIANEGIWFVATVGRKRCLHVPLHVGCGSVL